MIEKPTKFSELFAPYSTAKIPAGAMKLLSEQGVPLYSSSTSYIQTPISQMKLRGSAAPAQKSAKNTPPEGSKSRKT